MRATPIALLTLAVWAGGCAQDARTPGAAEDARSSPASDSGPPSAPLPPYLQDAPDPGDARAVARDRRRPAFQHMPYRAEKVSIDFVDQRGAKLIVEVRFTGTRVAARAAYRRFLARYRDTGRAYLVVYRKAAR